MSIEWPLFEEKYFKLEDGDTKNVVLCDWHSEKEYSFGDSKEKRPAIVFRVKSIQGRQVEHELYFVTTSTTLAADLRPIIMDAEAKGKETIYVALAKHKGRYVVFRAG